MGSRTVPLSAANGDPAGYTLNLCLSDPLISAMNRSRSAPLADSAQAICPHCRAPVWMYEAPTGSTVALDDAAGPYLIDGRGKAYRSDRRDGYQGHNCARHVRTPHSTQVTDDEFLWR